jgi:hypothetical protein
VNASLSLRNYFRRTQTYPSFLQCARLHRPRVLGLCMPALGLVLLGFLLAEPYSSGPVSRVAYYFQRLLDHDVSLRLVV